MAVSPDELESHLFKCADIIRDAVDSTDYKEYILPLVYYKSISDEFEKQYEENVEEYGEDFARRENLYDIPVVPEGHTWDDLRAVSDNVDEALNESFEALIGGVQIRMKSEAACFLSGSCSKTTASAVVSTRST